MDPLLEDLRYGVRSLRKAPGCACASIATIALGIGATTALFSTVNAALLRPLPFPNPNDLCIPRTTITTGRMASGLVAPVELTALNDPNGPVLHASGVRIGYEAILDGSARSMQIAFAGVAGDCFETFNAPMLLGRSFRPDERPRNRVARTQQNFGLPTKLSRSERERLSSTRLNCASGNRSDEAHTPSAPSTVAPVLRPRDRLGRARSRFAWTPQASPA